MMQKYVRTPKDWISIAENVIEWTRKEELDNETTIYVLLRMTASTDGLWFGQLLNSTYKKVLLDRLLECKPDDSLRTCAAFSCLKVDNWSSIHMSELQELALRLDASAFVIAYKQSSRASAFIATEAAAVCLELARKKYFDPGKKEPDASNEIDNYLEAIYELDFKAYHDLYYKKAAFLQTCIVGRNTEEFEEDILYLLDVPSPVTRVKIAGRVPLENLLFLVKVAVATKLTSINLGKLYRIDKQEKKQVPRLSPQEQKQLLDSLVKLTEVNPNLERFDFAGNFPELTKLNETLKQRNAARRKAAIAGAFAQRTPTGLESEAGVTKIMSLISEYDSAVETKALAVSGAKGEEKIDFADMKMSAQEGCSAGCKIIEAYLKARESVSWGHDPDLQASKVAIAANALRQIHDQPNNVANFFDIIENLLQQSARLRAMENKKPGKLESDLGTFLRQLLATVPKNNRGLRSRIERLINWSEVKLETDPKIRLEADAESGVALETRRPRH